MAHEYVKISELEPTASFGTADQFVIVQNDQTVKIDGAALIDSLATLTNLATRSYVDAVVDSAPGTLDTLRELATALNDDANFGANITALINEKLPASNFGLEFWNQLATVNTFHISEGSNLYWTQDRFDEALASKNTYHVAEGNNLYFTEQRVLDVVMPLIPTSFVTSYNDLTDKPTLFSGSYSDLTDKPTLFSGSYSDLTDKPTLFSGSYSDLINKPTIPTDINQLSDTDGLLEQGGGSYPTAPTFTSVTATNLNVQNVAFTGTGAVTITSGNDLNFTAAGDITFNGSTAITKTQLKSIVAASTDFADFKARIAAL